LCGEDDLRKFGQQMASVSCGEGMKMTEEPAVMTYAKADSDVSCSLPSFLPSFLPPFLPSFFSN